MMVDHYMGRLLEAVDRAGINTNTLIIFTSDNGCSPAAKIEEMTAKGHYPSYIFRGHKADIYEGGHRVPFIVRWPAAIKAGSENDETICTADLMATCAVIVGYTLKDNEGEDSYNLLPLLKGEPLANPLREATVHHSINGSFAIRKGDWKLIMCPGSGGWSAPRPDNPEAIKGLPRIQLYNLKQDPSETENLQETHPGIVEELKALLTKYIVEGRSTPGEVQANDGPQTWEQLWWMEGGDRPH
jgi:arylsulfatase A-like enzyme